MRDVAWIGRVSLAAVCALVAAGCGGGGGSADGDGSSDRKPLRVGMELAYPPFETVDEAGRPTGISVELAEALGRFLQRPVEILNIPFDGLIPSLKTGRIDAIISSMTVTEARDKSIDFSDPYVMTGLSILARRDGGIDGIDDLDSPGRTVAVKKGTTGHVYAAAHLKEARLRLLDKETLCIHEVESGRADAFLYDQMSVLRAWRRNPETTRPLLDPFQREAWAVGVREGDDALRERINRFLRVFRADGGFDWLAAEYFADELRVFEEFGVPFVFDVAGDGEAEAPR